MRRRPLALTSLSGLALTGVLVATTVPAAAAHGALVVTGLTASDRLVTFRASDASTILSEVKVTGVVGDLQGIDFRPANGDLLAVALADDGARLYTVDPATGAATQAGSTVYAIGGNLSIDVNPVVDRIRLVSDDGTNLRLHPDTGALAATDGDLGYVVGDAGEGVTPRVGAVAYADNDNSSATGTTLYDLDAAVGQLARQDPPNAGRLVSVGDLPQATKAQFSGFDIYTRTSDGVNWAFASLFHKGRTTFWEISLTDGGEVTATPAVPASGDVIGTRPHVTDIALAPAQAGF